MSDKHNETMNDAQLNQLIQEVKLHDMMGDEEEGGDSQDDDDDMDMDGMDLGGMLEGLFTEPKKNRNMVEVMCEIKRNLEVHNKLLMKLVQLADTFVNKS